MLGPVRWQSESPRSDWAPLPHSLPHSTLSFSFLFSPSFVSSLVLLTPVVLLILSMFFLTLSALLSVSCHDWFAHLNTCIYVYAISLQYKDVATSATRAIQNNFLDSSKQDAINVLLLGGRQRTTLDDVAYTLDLTNSMHGMLLFLYVLRLFSSDPISIYL